MCGRLQNWLKWRPTPECSVVAPEPPPPEFAEGEWVAVRLNERNKTRHVGQVGIAIWHFNSARYYYYLIENGEMVRDKDVHKRFFAEDLERVPAKEKLNPTP